MKTILSLLSVLCLSVLLPAQTGPESAAYTPAELDRLLAPIALYPDALIALILPASTEPSDVVLAARYLEAGGDPAQADSQPWNDSVKALAHYPEVVKWMDTNLEWTKSAGMAFLQQPAEVMRAVQRLRAQARAAGTLVDTPQQHVVVQDDNICIVPAQPDVIYVPAYDPDAVYGEQPASAGPWLTFDAGWPVGAWLNYECDWAGFGIQIGVWRPGWDWRRPHFIGSAGRPWRPDPNRERELRQHFNQPHPVVPQPRPMPGAPSFPHRPGENFRPGTDDRNFRSDDHHGTIPPRDFGHHGPEMHSTVPPSNPGRPAPVAPKPVPPPPAGLPNNSNQGAVPRDFDHHEKENHQSGQPPNQGRPAVVAPKPPLPPAGSPNNSNRGAVPPGFARHEQENHQPPQPMPNQGRPAIAPVRPPSQPPPKPSPQPPPSSSDQDKDKPPH